MPSVIYFSTSTCGYCKPVKTILEHIQTEYEEVIFTYLIVDTDPSAMAVAVEYNVNAVPTILIIDNAEEKERLIGDINREKIVDAIKRYI